MFLQRLIRRFEPTETRIIFLSAVMPNAEQFAEWITGDSSGLVASNWRPSRLMLGEAVMALLASLIAASCAAIFNNTNWLLGWTMLRLVHAFA